MLEMFKSGLFNKQKLYLLYKCDKTVFFSLCFNSIKYNIPLPIICGGRAIHGLQHHSKVSKIGDHSRGRPEGSLFTSYYTKV